MAKVMGSMAMNKPKHGDKISGILVKRNFNYHILAPSDLSGKFCKVTILFIILIELMKTHLARGFALVFKLLCLQKLLKEKQKNMLIL